MKLVVDNTKISQIKLFNYAENWMDYDLEILEEDTWDFEDIYGK